MSVALLVLRLVVGGLLAGHGSQKLFGWFNGRGLAATCSLVETIGLVPGGPFAIHRRNRRARRRAPARLRPRLAGRLPAARRGHGNSDRDREWKNGIWAAEGGFEFPLVIATIVFSVTAIGPGSISLDDLFGVEWASLSSAIATTVVGALSALATVTRARMGHPQGLPSRTPHKYRPNRRAPLETPSVRPTRGGEATSDREE